MDDQQSFNLIRQGGKMRDQGVTALYRKHAGHFRKFYLYQGLNVADAEDVVQETFFKIVRHCDTYNGDSPLVAWLWRIARNCMIDHIRTGKSRSTTDADKAADKMKKGAITLEHATAIEAGESRVQGGVKVTKLPYAQESEEKADRTSSPPMLISIDNDGGDDENNSLAALEGQFSSLSTYDPDPKSESFEDCIARGLAEFAKNFSERAHVLSLIKEGLDTAHIAVAIQRTPGATREYISQCYKRAREFFIPCQELRSAT